MNRFNTLRSIALIACNIHYLIMRDIDFMKINSRWNHHKINETSRVCASLRKFFFFFSNIKKRNRVENDIVNLIDGFIKLNP